MKGSERMADLGTVSYDQFVDIPSLGGKSKIIFSEKVYNYLNNLMNETKNESAEKGCYLVGRQSISDDGALCFYFDFCSSKFQTTSGNYANENILKFKKYDQVKIHQTDKYNHC